MPTDSAYAAKTNVNIMQNILKDQRNDSYRTPVGNPAIMPNSGAIKADFDKLLYTLFSKKGRAINRNRKNAKGWKTY